ncbi:hypothetical protein TYRP_016212, partial [Tyrophagus putrescentiae]
MLINGHPIVAIVISKQCNEPLNNQTQIINKSKNVVQCSICKLFFNRMAFNNHHRLCNNIGNPALAKSLAIAVLDYKLNDFNDNTSDDEANDDSFGGKLFDTITGELLCCGNGDFQLQLEKPQQTHSAIKNRIVFSSDELPPLEYSPQTAHLKGYTDQYIDARLGVIVETEQGTRHLQDAFRQGELLMSENKTKKCPFCFLYYQATYIGAHCQLCLKNTKPDIEPGSRVALYREALNRTKTGTSIFNDTQLIATPKMEFNLTKGAWLPNCNCTAEDENNLTAINSHFQYYAEHVQKERNEFPYK